MSMEISLQLTPGKLHLVIAPGSVNRQLANTFIARLGAAGVVRVLDGGNRFDAHGIARAVRRQTSDLYAALERIWIARAFTCYQMLALLAQIPTGPEPVLVLDLLSTFYDESVPEAERRRLLVEGLAHLQRLGRQAAVAVTATPLVQPGPAGRPLPVDFLARLEAAAEQVWRFETPAPQEQLRLF
jgi:hypothetical protein